MSGGPSDVEWVQIFRGIFKGMNLTTVKDIKSCVKDASDVPLHLKASFQAFEDRAVYKGLHLLGLAIGDVVSGMEDCGVEKAVTGRVRTYVTDLVSCVDKGWLFEEYSY